MKKNNYLITVTKEEILEMKVNESINFLFPILGYSVGYTKTFRFDEVNVPNSFLYLNRVFDCEAMKQLRMDLQNLNENIIGICFTDLGVLQLVRELGLSLKLIYMQNHNTTNVESINYYLEEVDSVLVSTDITKNEILSILEHAHKPLVVPYFCLVDAMYSRRLLLHNFQEEFKLPKKQEEILHEQISNMDFKAIENEYGTVLYAKKFIDYREIEHDNILYRYINPIGLGKEEIEKILNGEDLSTISNTGFLEKETYYRLKEKVDL